MAGRQPGWRPSWTRHNPGATCLGVVRPHGEALVLTWKKNRLFVVLVLLLTAGTLSGCGCGPLGLGWCRGGGYYGGGGGWYHGGR